MESKTYGDPEKRERVMPVPLDMSLAQIRSGIPKKYFERSALKSFAYLARDLLQTFAAFATMHYLVLPVLDSFGSNPATLALKAAFWCLYWFVQGTNFCAMWVLAGHEGGHGAFSASEFINELVGFTFHSLLLVPYHPWRVTHAQHHKFTNSLNMDTAFVPKKEDSPLKHSIAESPVAALASFLTSIVLGWPLYFTINVWGRDVPGASNMTHFLPNSGYFQSSDRVKVILSDVCLLLVLGMLGVGVSRCGWWAVFAYYFVPYLVCNAWLVVITFLHHSDVRVPHFDDKEFTYVRGATSAIDRDYGAWINPWLHHITDSHNVHHLFHEMPFYNAIEVTRKYIKPLIGAAYIEDHRPLFTQIAESWQHCLYVVPKEGVSYFRH